MHSIMHSNATSLLFGCIVKHNHTLKHQSDTAINLYLDLDWFCPVTPD